MTPGDAPIDHQTFNGYLDNDEFNLTKIRQHLPHFKELMPRIHTLYEVSRSLIPRTSQRVFGRCLLLCHKSFLSAAVAIGRRHPDDAAPITRRAIETATLAIAYKLDPKNLERWEQYEKRLKRWSERHEGKVPNPIRLRYKRIQDHAGLNALRRYEGILSDTFVHFTPEFVVVQAFRETTEGITTTIELPFLETDQRAIEQQLLLLGDIHSKIIHLLDECYDGAFSRDSAWQAASREVTQVGSALATHYMQTRPVARQEQG